MHDGGRIVDVNQALCDLGGYSWHELVGRDGFDFLAPENREVVYRNLLSEYDRPYEVECVRRDGTRIPVEVQARSFPYRGQVQRVVAIRDVSERKKSERVRESLIRELEAKNAELERFGYTVTHDLKAPLVTLRGFADYVEKDARAGRTDRLATDAARISEAVGKLQRLLDELFELSRAGRPVGPPAAVPAGDLVHEALRLVRGRDAGPADVEVASTLPVVFGDRARLVRVFQALLDNALKFAGPEPRGRRRLAAAPRGQGRGRGPRQRDRDRGAPPGPRVRSLREARPAGRGVGGRPRRGEADRRVPRGPGVARVGGKGQGNRGVRRAAPRRRPRRPSRAYGRGRASPGMSVSGRGASRNFRPSRWMPSIPSPAPVETYITSARVS